MAKRTKKGKVSSLVRETDQLVRETDQVPSLSREAQAILAAMKALTELVNHGFIKPFDMGYEISKEAWDMVDTFDLTPWEIHQAAQRIIIESGVDPDSLIDGPPFVGPN